MNFEDYRIAALRTMSKGDPSQGPGGANFNLRQAVWGLGLTGEAGEVAGMFLDPDVQPQDLMKELGDVLWYIAAFCSHNGWSMTEIAGSTAPITSFADGDGPTAPLAGAGNSLLLASACGAVADHVKKVVGHGHELDATKMKVGLRNVLITIAGMCNAHGLDLEKVCQANIDKLNKRYADGFSTAASLARVDVEAK